MDFSIIITGLGNRLACYFVVVRNCCVIREITYTLLLIRIINIIKSKLHLQLKWSNRKHQDVSICKNRLPNPYACYFISHAYMHVVCM